MNKEGGWNRYFNLTSNNEKLGKMIKDDNFEDPDEIQKYIDKEMNNVKFEAFGKVGCKKKGKSSPELIELQLRKIKVCFF